jgi:hypothetical protein
MEGKIVKNSADTMIHLTDELMAVVQHNQAN